MNIGDIKTDKHYHKSVWLACKLCGKERWVRIEQGKPLYHFCHDHCGDGEVFNKATGYWYVYKPNHPKANKRGYVKRAIIILEQKLGRPIKDGYDSHHKNEIKVDDSPDNLEEKRINEHRSVHAIKSKFWRGRENGKKS